MWLGPNESGLFGEFLICKSAGTSLSLRRVTNESSLFGEFLIFKSAGPSLSLSRVEMRDTAIEILLYLTVGFNRFAATFMTFFFAGDLKSSGRPELS